VSFLAGLAAVAALAAGPAEDRREATVGMSARIEQIVLPGPELQAKPVDPADPVLVRVLASWPHGTDFRYDLEYQGFEPGEHDLSAWLVRKDGSAAEGLPPIRVTIRSVLPEGRVTPHARGEGGGLSLGGYRTLGIVAGIAWIAGLVVLVRWIRPRRRTAAPAATRPRTLAERLRPLVERAMRNELSRAERAELELALLQHWKRRLGLGGMDPARALAELRAHPEAGALLAALEDWLHRPEPPRDVDLHALLAPYRHVAAEEPVRAGT
jgi:hypothetical protein